MYPAKGVTDLKLDVTSSPLQSSDAVIIHPGAMLAMLDLLASVGSVTQPEVSWVMVVSPCLVNGRKVCFYMRNKDQEEHGIQLTHHILNRKPLFEPCFPDIGYVFE